MKPTTTTPESIKASVNSQSINDLLTQLCTVRHQIDAFFESNQGWVMQEVSEPYHALENHLGEAINNLAQYVGIYAHQEIYTKLKKEDNNN